MIRTYTVQPFLSLHPSTGNNPQIKVISQKRPTLQRLHTYPPDYKQELLQTHFAASSRGLYVIL